ncbi:hypothetical protein [Cohnella herbarum]|uniref:Dehydrogenase n=1 Tax=Cohnella herbarum TaxID=2728023 RepID=A0A7Z2ZN55_9BACL|nr:hypothetical protein [Cohnella herbarum]QJD86046.1 hypothetical protein HH215_24635 [Cohnella herbarum]
MATIGFIDYYLDEWHADNLPGWIAEATNDGMQVKFAYGLIDSPHGLSNAEWCRKHGIELLDSIEEVVERSDYLAVLSPDHPEFHERLAALPLQSAKPTFVDKTFAPDRAAAIRLFDAASRSGTPLFSSSALRFASEYTDELNRSGGRRIDTLCSQGPGQFGNYAIHQIEPIVSIMGADARRVQFIGTERTPALVIEYSDGRRATMHHLEGSPFRLTYQYEEGVALQATAEADFFAPFVRSLVRFFQTGQSPVDPAETIAVITIIEYARKAAASPGMWLELPS